MTITVTSFEELEKQMPRAWTALQENFHDNLEVFDDFEEFCSEFRWCADDQDEKVDSCYITKTYFATYDCYEFSVVGSSYRKDQSVCEEEVELELTVTNLEAKYQRQKRKHKTTNKLRISKLGNNC